MVTSVELKEELASIQTSLRSHLPNEIDWAIKRLTIRSCDGLLLEETPGLLIELLTIPHCRYFLVAAELGDKLFSAKKSSKAGSGWFSLLHPEARLDRLAPARQDELRMFGLRVMQVMHILQNMSSEQANYKSMAESEACLRFLTRGMAAGNAGVHAQQPIFDEVAVLDQHKVVIEGQALATLANISPWVDVEALNRGAQTFLKEYLRSNFHSPDRAILVGVLNMFSRLCMLPGNKAWVLELVGVSVGRFVQLLAFEDTQVLLAALEVLYQLTMWKDTAVLVAKTGHCIKTLIAMLEYHLDTLEDRPDPTADDAAAAQRDGRNRDRGARTAEATTSVSATNADNTIIELPPPLSVASSSGLPAVLCSKPSRNYQSVLRTAELWWRSNYEAAPDEPTKCVIRSEVYDLYVEARKGEPTVDRVAFGDVARICCPEMEELVVSEMLGRRVIYLGVKARNQVLSKAEAWQESEHYRELKLPYIPPVLKHQQRRAPHGADPAALAAAAAAASGRRGLRSSGSASDIRTFLTPEMMSAASAIFATAAAAGGPAAEAAQAMAAAIEGGGSGIENMVMGGGGGGGGSGGGGGRGGIKTEQTPVVLSVPAPKPVKLAVPAPKPVKLAIPAQKPVKISIPAPKENPKLANRQLPVKLTVKASSSQSVYPNSPSVLIAPPVPFGAVGTEAGLPLDQTMAAFAPTPTLTLDVFAPPLDVFAGLVGGLSAPVPTLAAAPAAVAAPFFAEPQPYALPVDAMAAGAANLPPSFPADPFQPVVRHELDMRTNPGAGGANVGALFANAGAEAGTFVHTNSAAMLNSREGFDITSTDVISRGFGSLLPQTDGPDDGDAEMNGAEGGGGEATQRAAKRPRSDDDERSAGAVRDDENGAAASIKSIPAKKSRKSDDAEAAFEDGPSKGKSPQKKLPISSEPTDALLVKQWSSRNPVQIPNYPALDDDETEHAYLQSEIAVQQGEAAASHAKMKERAGIVWAFDFGQDNATVAGIRFAAALVLRNLANSPGNKALFAPFEAALLQAAVTDAPEKSVLACCLLGLS